jgi:predicted transcriptional regulator
MIDFACKEFDLDEVLKCALGLTRAEMRVLKFFLNSSGNEMTASQVAKKTGLELSTIQKAVKKLSEKKIVFRGQRNLKNGGYEFFYRLNDKKHVREIIKGIIRKWFERVEAEIDNW